MKNKVRSISIVGLLLVALVTVVIAKAEYTATVINHSTSGLGTVTLFQSAGDPVYVNVPGPGQFNADVATGVTLVVINNQPTKQGSYSVVTLASGAKVKVTVSGNIIVVGDTQEVN